MNIINVKLYHKGVYLKYVALKSKDIAVDL